MSKKNLLIFGCDFFRDKKSSEINFWNDLSEQLSYQFNEIAILSINNRRIFQEKIGDNIFLYNVSPLFLGEKGSWENSDYSGKGFHKLPFSIFYKSFTFLRLQPIFDHLINRHNVGIVHYMRIFGLLNKILTFRYPDIVFSITVPTHIDRGFPLHIFYHQIKNAAMRPMDRIVPTSEATCQKLIQLGLPRKRLKTIHWTSNINSENFSYSDIRNELGLRKDAQIILWSGPLQDASKQEFFFARAVAKKVLERTKKFSFVFAFKPNTLNPEYLTFDCQDMQCIRIIETDFNAFCSLKREAVLFLSPVCNKKRTVAPAMTWIEMMQIGVPVMTTDIEGVSELIKHGENGFIVSNVDEAISNLLGFEATKQLRDACKNYIRQNYNIKHIARQYIDMWSEAAKKQRSN